MYKCAYCTLKTEQFGEIVEHLASEHRNKELCLKVKLLSPHSGKFVYKTRHYNIIPSGKVIQVVEPESIIAFKQDVDIPQPKRRLLGTETEENDTESASSEGMCISDDEAERSIQEMHRLIPKVIDELNRHQHLGEFMAYMRLMAEHKFPNKNIAYLLFLDVCKFLSNENSVSMRYSKEVKEFWRTGYQLFHGKFLRFATGYKNIGQIVNGSASRGLYSPSKANINFVVPSPGLLRSDSLDLPTPGILHEMLNSITNTDFEGKSYKICVDGKKIIHAPKDEKSEIDLFGYEFPSKSDRDNRLQEEEVSVNNYLTLTQRLLDLEYMSSKEFSEDHVSEIYNDIVEILKILSARLRDLREMRVKKYLLRQKFRDMAGVSWQKSKYSMVISAISVHLLRIEEVIHSTEEMIDKLSYFLASMNNCGFNLGGNPIRLGEQTTYLCLQEMSETQDSPELIKQRTAKWHVLRDQAKVTGSTLYRAIGLESLKKLKEHYDKVMNGKNIQEKWDDDTQRRLDHGNIHEIDGIATLVSKVIPVWYPDMVYTEEGCYKLLHDGYHLGTISPDGSLRNKETMAAQMAVEIKCPFPNEFKPPVQYEIPQRYVMQLLAEMYALKVERLLYLSYSAETTAVYSVSFDKDLWEKAWQEAVRLYHGATSSKPTKTSPVVADLRNRIATFCRSNVQFLGEVLSVTAIKCRQDDHKSVGVSRGLHENPYPFVTPDIPIKEMERAAFRCGNLIRDCHSLTKAVASEVLVFIMTDLDRLYNAEIPHAIPVAYGLKGYSLATDALRKTLQHVLLACHQKGMYVPVASFDGQWYRLAVRDANDNPLTKLQLQKDVWKSAQKCSKQEILRNISSFGLTKPESLSNADESHEVYRVKRTEGMITIERNGDMMLRPFSTSENFVKALHSRLNTSTTTCDESVSPDIDDVCSILVQENKEIPDDELLSIPIEASIDTGTVRNKDVDLGILTEVLNAGYEAEVDADSTVQTESVQQCVSTDTNGLEILIEKEILVALQKLSDENKRKKWMSTSVTQYQNLYKSFETFCSAHTKQELLLIHDKLNTLGHYAVQIYSSWRKKRIAVEIFAFVTGQREEVSLVTQKKSRRIQSLKKLTMDVIKTLSKQALAVAYAEHIWDREYAEWAKRIPINKGQCIVGIDTHMDWYSTPEYDHRRGMYQFNILDPYHLMTNARVTVCTRGLKRAGVNKESFLKVAESCKENGIGLSLPMVEELIDKQNIAFALTTFSADVADELRKLGDNGSAEFCDLIRNWYSAEDDPGMKASDRVFHRLALRQWLLRDMKFNSFPPPGNTVNDIPITMFEGLLTNTERRMQLYAYLPSGTYNARALGSLDAETFFSGFQDIDPKGTGILRPNAIPKAMKSATDIVSTKLQENRSFHLRTSRKTVYPVKKVSEKRIDDTTENKHWNQPTIVQRIIPRDHPFDTPDRRRTKGQRKCGTVSAPEHPGRGAMPIRQFHKRDETKILSHKRAGVSLDFS